MPIIPKRFLTTHRKRKGQTILSIWRLYVSILHGEIIRCQIQRKTIVPRANTREHDGIR